MERGIHGTWEHIAPQIVKQITAMQNPETKSKITENYIKEISRKHGFTESLSEIDIKGISIHDRINKILKKEPIIALPIDFVPNDLEEWALSLKVPVKIWLVEKYSDLKGNILYNIPEIDKDNGKKNGGGTDYKIDRSSGGLLEKKVVRAGFLKEGQRVYMDYGKMGESKTHFDGIIRLDGIEVVGTVSSPSTSAVRCIQTVNPERTRTNGWLSWKTDK